MSIRDENGRFVKGHKGLPNAGRKPADREREYLAAMKAGCSPEQLQQIIEKVVKHLLEAPAPSSNLLKVLLFYLVPLPEQRKVLEIVDDRSMSELLVLIQKLNSKGIDMHSFLYRINEQLELQEKSNDRPQLQ